MILPEMKQELGKKKFEFVAFSLIAMKHFFVPEIRLQHFGPQFLLVMFQICGFLDMSHMTHDREKTIGDRFCVVRLLHDKENNCVTECNTQRSRALLEILVSEIRNCHAINKQ